MADRQPAVLLLLRYRDGLATDCSGHDGTDGTGKIRRLLEERGILELNIRLRKPECGMSALCFCAGFQPLFKLQFAVQYS